MKLMAMVAVLAFTGVGSASAAELVVSVESFDQPLAPYGEWVMEGGFGRVWRPSVAVVGVDFVPYSTSGRWVLSDDGWAFESDYPWGWAPFHYGRWYLSPAYGWVWAPETTWGPSWVEWRYGGGYSGWAPLPPARVGLVVHSYAAPWFFVETRYVAEPHVYQYALPAPRVHQAMAVTAVLPPRPAPYGNANWHPGPPPSEVERQAGHPVPRSVLVAPPRPPGGLPPPPPGVSPPHASSAARPLSPPIPGLGEPARPPPERAQPQRSGQPPAPSAAVPQMVNPPRSAPPPEPRDAPLRQPPQQYQLPQQHQSPQYQPQQGQEQPAAPGKAPPKKQQQAPPPGRRAHPGPMPPPPPSPP